MKMLLLASSVLALMQPQFASAREKGQSHDIDLAIAFPDLAITQVWSGGFWQVAEVDGYIRFVVTSSGFEHVSNQLYIEWISNGAAPGEATLETRVSVTELNDADFWAFSAPTCLIEPQCQTFRIEATHTYSLQSGEFELRLTGIGTYQIEQK